MNDTIKYALENISAARLHLDNLGVGEITEDEVKALYVVVDARFENGWETTYTSPYNDILLIEKLTPTDECKLYAHAIVGRLIEMRIVAHEPVKNTTAPPMMTEQKQERQDGNYPFKKISRAGRTPHPVAQYELTTGAKLGEFPSISAAQKATGIDDASIARCCRGDYVHAGGYMWKYAAPVIGG